MNWEEYKLAYAHFAGALARAALVSYVGGEVFDDFPQNLPESFRAVLKETEATYDLGEGPEIRLDLKTKDPRFLMIVLDLAMSKFKLQQEEADDPGARNDEPRAIKDSLLASELIATIAHLDAFLRDSLRVVCHARPEIVKMSEKTMTWKEAFASAPEGLFDRCVNEYVSAIARGGGVLRIVDWLVEKQGLSIELAASRRHSIEVGEQVRHLLVHHHGRVDSPFLRRVRIPDIRVGEQFPLSSAFVVDIGSAAAYLGGDVLEGIRRGLFPEAAKSIWRTGRWEGSGPGDEGDSSGSS